MRRSQLQCDKGRINATYSEIRAWLGRLSRGKHGLADCHAASMAWQIVTLQA